MFKFTLLYLPILIGFLVRHFTWPRKWPTLLGALLVPLGLLLAIGRFFDPRTFTTPGLAIPYFFIAMMCYFCGMMIANVLRHHRSKA